MFIFLTCSPTCDLVILSTLEALYCDQKNNSDGSAVERWPHPVELHVEKKNHQAFQFPFNEFYEFQNIGHVRVRTSAFGTYAISVQSLVPKQILYPCLSWVLCPDCWNRCAKLAIEFNSTRMQIFLQEVLVTTAIK